MFLGIFRQWILDVIELASDVLMLDFDIGQSGQATGAPVNQAFAPVDQALVIEPDEYFSDRPREAIVHGKPQAGPVTGGAQSFQLFDDCPAGLGFPFPDALHKAIPPHGFPCGILLQELLLHNILRGNTGMIRAGNPKGIATLHTPPSDQDILHGGVESMPHV